MSVVAVWVATVFVAGLVDAAGRLRQPLVILLMAVAEGSLLLAVWWFGLRRKGGSLSHLGFKALPSGAAYFLPVAVVFLSLAVTALYYQAVKALGVEALLPPPLPEPLRPGAEARWAPFLVAVVLAPVAEESFFRGFLIPPLAQRWGFRLAVVVSGLTFAVIHGAVAVMLHHRPDACPALSEDRLPLELHHRPQRLQCPGVRLEWIA